MPGWSRLEVVCVSMRDYKTTHACGDLQYRPLGATNVHCDRHEESIRLNSSVTVLIIQISSALSHTLQLSRLAFDQHQR